MLFNSLQFLIFLPVVVMLYYLMPAKWRWVLLLLASYYFYMCWKVEYIGLILLSTLIDYGCGLKMGKIPTQKQRVPYLIVSLLINLGLLFIFKYANFGLETINQAFYKFGMPQRVPYLNVLLPVGISFYTFQTLSYSIEVFYGKIKPEKHLGYFALYVAFFPQLVAGPIERYTRLAPQFRIKQFINYDNFAQGFRLILYGLFIKMVIADNLAIYADMIYEQPTTYNSLSIITGLVYYSFQIYCDFYGYSLIAIGSAKFLGINIMDNFRTPYLARNIGEFWQRWHISLSTWFRDYLYFPLGGNKVKKYRWLINIMIVFTVSGLWHGANWTFVIWGSIFGVVYLIEKTIPGIGKIRAKDTFTLPHVGFVVIVFIITSIAWVFFRSENIDKVIAIYQGISQNLSLNNGLEIPVFVWTFLGLFIASDIALYNKRFDTWIANKHTVIRWIAYSVLIISIVLFTGMKDIPFIYFQF